MKVIEKLMESEAIQVIISEHGPENLEEIRLFLEKHAPNFVANREGNIVRLERADRGLMSVATGPVFTRGLLHADWWILAIPGGNIALYDDVGFTSKFRPVLDMATATQVEPAKAT